MKLRSGIRGGCAARGILVNVMLAMLFIHSFERNFRLNVITRSFTFSYQGIEWLNNLNSDRRLRESRVTANVLSRLMEIPFCKPLLQKRRVAKFSALRILGVRCRKRMS
jgi:hypothetical protein